MVSQILWCFIPPALAPRTPKWYVYARLRTTVLEYSTKFSRCKQRVKVLIATRSVKKDSCFFDSCSEYEFYVIQVGTWLWLLNVSYFLGQIFTFWKAVSFIYEVFPNRVAAYFSLH